MIYCENQQTRRTTNRSSDRQIDCCPKIPASYGALCCYLTNQTILPDQRRSYIGRARWIPVGCCHPRTVWIGSKWGEPKTNDGVAVAVAQVRLRIDRHGSRCCPLKTSTPPLHSHPSRSTGLYLSILSPYHPDVSLCEDPPPSVVCSHH